MFELLQLNTSNNTFHFDFFDFSSHSIKLNVKPDLFFAFFNFKNSAHKET